MANLTFADTHNMVAYLSKSDASAGFDQIVDFLYAQVIHVKRTAWNEFSCLMASAIICLATVIINAQVDDLSSHTNQYTSPALTQKVFANMRRVGMGFSRVETPLFATMMVQPQPPAAEEEDEVEVPNAPSPPSTSNAPSPPPQASIPTPLQAQPNTPPSPPQEQPTTTSKSSMTLLNTLMETSATLSQKVAQLEQDKIAQALEIFKLKKRVKKLEKKRRSKSSGLKRIEAIDVDEDITLVDAKTQVDVELHGRKDDDNAAIKKVNAAEPTVFDDEEVIMTMAQTLIKMKVKKARLLDEQIAKRLHDEEEMSKEDVKNMLEIVSVTEFKVESLQVKYPLIDWDIYFEGSRSYWKIIRVGGITEAYQSFEDMLKGFDREDLDAL
nr:hypothetical protein [Tanacetum cinerariifolium]